MSEKNIVKVPILMKILEERGMANKISKGTGISSGNISDWKSGKSAPNIEAITKIADYLGYSVDYLLGRTDNLQSNEANIDPETAAAIELFANLPPDKRALALKIIKVFSEG